MAGVRRVAAALAAGLLLAPGHCAVQESEDRMNPIRKVVNLLQAMQKKVTEEGKKEEELYEKFHCYCKTGAGDLSASIASADAKVPAVQSDIEASEGKLAQTKEDLKQAQVDRSAAKDAMAEATGLREKEAQAYAAQKSEYDSNIGAIDKAVGALEKGMAGGFLQTTAAETLRKLALGKQDLLDADRQALVAFLSNAQGESNGYVPAGGEVVGILKELGDEMRKSLADITAAETGALTSYEELMAAKRKEISALTDAIESKTQAVGELGVAIVQMKEDLTDTEEALLADQKYLAELDTSCKTKAEEWQERQKTRAEELVAIADTIKVLNDDDALDLFKATLPSSASSASLLQLQKSASRMRARALEVLRLARRSSGAQDHVGLDLIALALQGKRGRGQKGFEKVIHMIDNMVQVLKTEQNDDEHKREYCNAQFDQADDKKKELERVVSDKESALDSGKEAVASLGDEIVALERGIKALDKSVMEATEQRKEEHAEYSSLLASNNAAKQLLEFAKNRLNKFYNPALHRAQPKRELTEEERLFVNQGGTPPPTEAPGGIAGTGVEAPALVEIAEHRQLRRDAPAPPPSTWDAYSKKTEGSTGVIAMIDLLIRDLVKETTEAETQEKNSQEEYEALMSESAAKRAADSKSLAEKNGAKASIEADLEQHAEERRGAVSELMATTKYIASLHSECDWLIQHYDLRKEARANERDSLQRAKAVLNGADFALVQTSRSSRFLGK